MINLKELQRIHLTTTVKDLLVSVENYKDLTFADKVLFHQICMLVVCNYSDFDTFYKDLRNHYLTNILKVNK
jgi:hypothetical protein